VIAEPSGALLVGQACHQVQDTREGVTFQSSLLPAVVAGIVNVIRSMIVPVEVAV
jgi:hypothetical protein